MRTKLLLFVRQMIKDLQQIANYKVRTLFPSLVFEYQITEIERQDLLDKCYKLKNQSPKSEQNSNMGGWHSLHIPTPDQILKYIPFEYSSTISWYMVNNYGHGNSSHCHPRSDWSGVVYLKSPDPEAYIEFEHPQCFEQYRLLETIPTDLKDKYCAWQAYKIMPQERTMLLFPASLRHRVFPNNTHEDRVSLSFNIKL